MIQIVNNYQIINTTPLVNSYLVGATFGEKKQFNQEIVELNKDIIKIATNGAKEFKLCLLISNFENSFKTDDLGIIVDADDHTWFQTSKDAQKILVSTYEIPSDIVDFVQLMGISGFTSLSDHIRVEVNEEQENDDNAIKVEFGTWDESTIKSLSFYGFYIGNQEVKFQCRSNLFFDFSSCLFIIIKIQIDKLKYLRNIQQRGKYLKYIITNLNATIKDKRLRFATTRLSLIIMDKLKAQDYLRMLYLLFTERKNLKERDLELNQVNHAWMHCILENEHLYIKKKLIIIL